MIRNAEKAVLKQADVQIRAGYQESSFTLLSARIPINLFLGDSLL